MPRLRVFGRHSLLLVAAALAVVLAIVLAPRPARASGRFPASSAVIFDPHDAKTLYVRATFGLLVSHDSGGSWHWICEGALDLSGTEDPKYVVTPKGTVIGATLGGISVSRDGACTFSLVGGPGAHVVSDLAMRKNGELVGISLVPGPGKKGVTVYDNHVRVSTDDAQTFSIINGSPIDPTLHVESVEIAESDPARLYMSAVRGEGEGRTAALLVSYDVGLSWVERKLELTPGETTPFIALVDPKRADRVYVRTAGTVDAHTRLLVTDDAGKTWRKIVDASTPIAGLALSADGSRVMVGSREGVSIGTTDTFVFSKGSSVEVQCLGLSGDVLWACSTERAGFFLGASKSNGRGFDAKLHLDQVKGPLECPWESGVATTCTDAWPKLRRELGLPDPSEPVKVRDPGGPALKGRGVRNVQSRSKLRAVAGIALAGMAVYFVLKRLRRGR